MTQTELLNVSWMRSALSCAHLASPGLRLTKLMGPTWSSDMRMKMVGPVPTAKPRLSDAETCTMVRFWTDMCDKFAARHASVAAQLLKAEETIIETLRGLNTQQAKSVERRQAFRCVLRICSARTKHTRVAKNAERIGLRHHRQIQAALDLLKAHMYILPTTRCTVPQRGAGKQPDALQH